MYSEKSWNPVTYEQAVSLPLSPESDFPAYVASKKLAEKAAFDFVETEYLSQFVLERNLALVLLLSSDIGLNRFDLGEAYGKHAVAALPCEIS